MRRWQLISAAAFLFAVVLYSTFASVSAHNGSNSRQVEGWFKNRYTHEAVSRFLAQRGLPSGRIRPTLNAAAAPAAVSDLQE